MTSSLHRVTKGSMVDGDLLTQTTGGWKREQCTVSLEHLPNESAPSVMQSAWKEPPAHEEHLLTTHGCQNSCNPQTLYGTESSTAVVKMDMQHHPGALSQKVWWQNHQSSKNSNTWCVSTRQNGAGCNKSFFAAPQTANYTLQSLPRTSWIHPQENHSSALILPLF